ncbi:MAG: histone deacetylase [SAR324 cluster bacterium]|nr:histone deacetylase [SAR324 cluster bacterium]
MKTGFYFDPVFFRHETGLHPENSKRLESIENKVVSSELYSKLEKRSAVKASPQEISTIHSYNLIAEVEDACSSGLSYIGTTDCTISPQTYDVALYAAGTVIEAVTQVSENQMDNAFCAVRPPGHHAEYDQAMGFCFFNNIAIAAEFLLKNFGYQRIAIIDIDVHHGNGTQHIFEDRKDVLYVSIHQDPRTCYPGTGFAHENGRGEGKGYTLNYPMRPGDGDREYTEVFKNYLIPACKEYKPEFILVSAGFDAHEDDPLAFMNLSDAGFRMMFNELKKLAEHCSQGKIVSVLEGGYAYDALSRCVLDHLTIFQQDQLESD